MRSRSYAVLVVWQENGRLLELWDEGGADEQSMQHAWDRKVERTKFS
jgi:hypothetical protein